MPQGEPHSGRIAKIHRSWTAQGTPPMIELRWPELAELALRQGVGNGRQRRFGIVEASR